MKKGLRETLIGAALIVALAVAIGTMPMAPSQAKHYVLDLVQDSVLELEITDIYTTVYVSEEDFDLDPKLREALEVLETRANWEVVICD